MLTIINHNKDPRFNLALEEYVLKYLNVEEDFILLWQNEPSVIIGRNQNTLEEININYVKEHQIHVVRRISGGGAVYHDFGNLNYTFVTNNIKDNLNNYQKFTKPVIDILKKLGVPAEFAGRNDIIVDGKKFSGNAQSYYKNRMFHHGTLLFNADLDMVSHVLQVSKDKIESKGIKSNRGRVTNLSPYLKQSMTILEFQNLLLKNILETENITPYIYHLTEQDYEKIYQLKKEKYDTWEWNYGKSPICTIQKAKRYLGGKVDFLLNIKDGLIHDVTIFGDFFGKLDIEILQNKLRGIRFLEDEVKKVLEEVALNDFFYNITIEDLLDCLFNSN